MFDLYRLPAIYDPAIISRKLMIDLPIEQHLQHAYLDAKAIEGVARLTSGEVRNWDQIRSAELAARCIVFHHRTTLLRPEYGVARIAEPKTHTGMFSGTDEYKENFRHGPNNGFEIVGEPIGEVGALDAILTSDAFDTLHVPIHMDLASFSSEAVLTEHKKYRAQLDKPVLDTKPVIRWNGGGGEVVPFLEKDQDYFDQVVYENDAIMASLLGLLPKTGSAVYLGRRSARTLFDQHISRLNDQLFEQIDLAWNEEFGGIRGGGLRFPVPPILLILLSRAARREDIPVELLALKADFERAREQLWSELLDAVSAPTLDVQVRLTGLIERDAQEILAGALGQRDPNWLIKALSFPIRIALNGVAEAATWAGLIKSQGDWSVGRLGPRRQYIDAARFLSSELAEAEGMVHALQKHLSDAEMENLQVDPALIHRLGKPSTN